MNTYSTVQDRADQGPLDKASSLVKVKYSRNGKDFVPWGLEQDPKKPRELADVHHVWVRLEPALGGEAAGPFQLPFSFNVAARDALTLAWKELDQDDKQRFACEEIVNGNTLSGHYHFLAIITEIEVGRGEGGLWRKSSYGSDDYLFEDSFERAMAPVGPSDFIVQVRLQGGKKEVFNCKREGLSVARKGGQYYRLKRSSESSSFPKEIEIYLLHQDNWEIYFSDGLTPSYVRVSSGGDFRTIEYNSRSVPFKEARGDQLILRFIGKDGTEVEYRGKVDFDAYQFSTLRDTLFSQGRLVCSSKVSEKAYKRRTNQRTEPVVACWFTSGRADPDSDNGFSVAATLPVLRSVTFGCARNHLDLEDLFDDERALGAQGKWETLIFTLPRLCDTVFAQFTLTDGSVSDVLAAPVLSRDPE